MRRYHTVPPPAAQTDGTADAGAKGWTSPPKSETLELGPIRGPATLIQRDEYSFPPQ
jgi:hypothetical protein